MITLKVFETKLNEGELLLKLLQRGRHADIPYYKSVENYSLEKGEVIFDRLDCAPNAPFKVMVAGNSLIVNERHESNVKSWLNEWQVEFTEIKKIQAETGAEALALVNKYRAEICTPAEREKMVRDARKKILEFNKQEDNALLNQGY